jgi:hypothetical protein
MAISTVYIYYVANQQLANRQFVLQPSATLLSTNLNIKNTGDIYQEIHIPYAAANATANMMKIDNKYYDIVSVDNATFKETSTIYSIALNPVSTYLTNGLSVTGYWDKTPGKVNYGCTFNIGEDTFIQSNKTEFGKLAAVSGITGQPYYFQITTTWDIFANAEGGEVIQYAGFAPYLKTMLAWAAASSIRYNTVTSGRTYPSIPELIYSLDTLLGIPASSILSVSISPRSPYKYAAITSGISIQTPTGTNVTPLNSSKTATIALVDLTNSEAGQNPGNDSAQTLTLTDYERFCGRVFVVDDKGNEIALIPNQWFNASNQLSYYVNTYSDINGIYSYVIIGNHLIPVPETQLPWVGEAWIEYAGRSLAYDREATARAIETTQKAAEMAAVSGVANTGLSVVMGAGLGGIGGGTAGQAVGGVAGGYGGGVGTIMGYRKAQIDKANIKQNQIQKENNVLRAPATAVNTQYGLDSCYIPATVANGYAGFKIMTPKNFTATDFNNYVAVFGYPCNRYATFNLAAGYVKGNLLSMPSSVGNGVEMNMLRNEIADGFIVKTA